jgi:hypothetical protein
MMWAVVLMLLCVCFVVALWWKPGRVRSSLPSAQSVASLVAPRAPSAHHERDAVLEDEIEIISRLIREDEAERRRLAAMERLASLKSTAKASGK